MDPVPDPTTVLPRPAPATYLVALAAEDGVEPVLDALPRLVARAHRVVVLADDGLAPAVLGAGAEHRPWGQAPSGDPVARTAEATCRAIDVLRPDAVLVTPRCLGSLVAAERSLVPLALLVADGALVPDGRAERSWRAVLPALNEVRAAHGLEPLRRVVDQLDRADRHVVLGPSRPGVRPDAADRAVVDDLEALPRCRPWLLVARHGPSRPVAGERRVSV